MNPARPRNSGPGGAGLPSRAGAWRTVAWQAGLAAALVLGAAALAATARHNLAARHIAAGFGFLARPAPIPIGESPIDWAPGRHGYGRAILIGLLNTLKVSLPGLVLATGLGGAIGLARLSGNWLLARLAAAYVELVRGVPLLLQLWVWYAALLVLPAPAGALRPLPFAALCDRGLWLPGWRDGHLDPPVLGRFGFVGGVSLSPEYLALLAGLTAYAAAYVAEIVRAGLLAVPRGQREAAAALGLPPGAILRRVAAPQALATMLPPLAGQYVNLVKNSSLAVAIGYPEITSIADVAINQTGQAIEGVAIVVAAYLSIGSLIGLGMGRLEARASAWAR